MHEHHITQQIIKIAQETAQLNNASKVTRISLVVGEFSGFIGDSIVLYFDILSEGTLCEGAQLEIEYIPMKMWCTHCSTYFKRKKYSFDCPACGHPGAPTNIGKEFYVDHIEIATSTPDEPSDKGVIKI